MPTGSFAWFTAATYPAHYALDPAGLPKRFKVWLQKAQALQREAEAQGIVVVRVELDPQEFAAWCAAAARHVDAKARAAFAIVIWERRNRH